MFSGGSGRPYLVEGVGEDFFPAAWEPDLLDDIIPISDEESFLTARYVSEREGILIGGSGGMAVAAAIKVAKAADPDDVVVVFNPDSGRGYLSRVFDDDWMANFGFLRECDQCVGAVLDTRNASIENLLYVNPHQPVSEAIELMRSTGVSQLPVCKNTPPFAAAEVSGAIDELELMEVDPPRPRRDVDPGREGDGPEAPHDRRRPEGRTRRRDARVRARRCSCCPAAVRSACSPAPTCSRTSALSPKPPSKAAPVP